MKSNSILIDDFLKQKECDYKGEHYSVRDNGSVYRHKPIKLLNARPLDNKWTFGKKDDKTGYMTIGTHRVHIIVATAFLGANDSKKFIVDHIDYNRCNNRVANLRWFTKLENALSKPAIRMRIEAMCGGDINKYIENPACLKYFSQTNKNIMWMSKVSSEEVRNAYNRLRKLGNIPNIPHYKTNYNTCQKSNNLLTAIKPFVSEYTDSLTDNAKQINWKIPTEFPLCPYPKEGNTLNAYALNLLIGKVITKNIYNSHLVDEYVIVDDKLFVRAHTNDDAVKRYSLITISYKEGFFIHEGITFFEECGARKAFLIAAGKEFTGENGVDDYC